MQEDTLALALILEGFVQTFPQRPSNTIHDISVPCASIPSLAFYL